MGTKDGEQSTQNGLVRTIALIAGYIRNIITHHAEDGSGVGSAIIAGAIWLHSASTLLLSDPLPAAMTKIRKDKGQYLHV